MIRWFIDIRSLIHNQIYDAHIQPKVLLATLGQIHNIYN
jgi:hypothetical protein